MDSSLVEAGLHPGYQLGGYALLERIGYGGQAVIWSAWDARRERVVAVKLIPTLGDDPHTISSSFEREAHLLAGLSHPNILPLYEFGATDTHYYFAMRYICLGSLRDLLSSGPIPPQEVLRMVAQVTSALEYLHDRGIVHRDLKPGNLLIDSANRVYLADFGLAKTLTDKTTPLHTGRGTGPYASTEQHTGFRATPRSDIYSLGIVLYEMLTAQLPWDGTLFLGMQQLQGHEQLPDPCDVNPALPATLAGALRMLTAADPMNRPSSAVEAFDVVATVLIDGPQDDGLVDLQSTKPLISLDTQIRLPSPEDEQVLTGLDAQHLLHRALQNWDPESTKFGLRETHFALVESVYSRPEHHGVVLEDAHRSFMLHGSLIYGHGLDYWWRQVAEPHARLRVCEQVILSEEEAAIARTISQMLKEPAEATCLDALSPAALERLIDLAINAGGASLRSDALEVLALSLIPATRWQSTGFTVAGDVGLAELALSDSPQSKQAARLIGQARSKTAIRALINQQGQVGTARLLEALKEVHAVTGSLSRSVPVSLRLRIIGQVAREQLLEDREGLSWSRILIGLTVGVVASLMLAFDWFSAPDAQLRDLLLVPYDVSDVVTIVEVDDASLQRYGRWDEWPRTLHADLINQLSVAGARAIVLDVNFVSETPEDAVLAAAIRHAGNVVQPVSGQGDAYHDIPGVSRYDDGIWPQPDLLTVSAAVGHSNILHDSDGYVRRVPTIISIGNQRYPSLALAAIQVFLGTQVSEIPSPSAGLIAMVGRKIPVGESGEMRIHYAGPPAQPSASTFQMVSYEDVLDGTAPPTLFKDRIVLVGITATAVPDRFLTPVGRGRPMYGVEIQANAIETIWAGRFLSEPGIWLRVVILLLLGVLTGLICTRPWLGLAFAAGEGVLYFYVATRLLDLNGIMLDLLYPFVTIGISYAIVTSYRFSIEVRRRRQVMRLFETRVAPEVARATIDAVRKGEVNLEGQILEVSVLFAQIRGYSAYAELHEPEEVMDMVSTFLGMAVDVVLAHEGMVAHHEGNQIMVIFNAPLAQPDHAQRAVQVGLDVREQVDVYHATLPADHPHWRVNLGYGVHTGKAVVGFAGSSSRYSYTALGDTIDIADRLASAAESGQILISGPTYDSVMEIVVASPRSPVLVADRSIPVPVFAVEGLTQTHYHPGAMQPTKQLVD